MRTVGRPDGVEIAWREAGAGPAVVLANFGYVDPAPFAGLVEELARDHRVISYDPRGSGESSRAGPYDLATDVADLVAVGEGAGAEAAVVVGNGDGGNRAVKAAVERPDLFGVVVVPGSVSLPGATRGSEGLAGSAAVLRAVVTLLENDYRAGVHAFVSNGNPDLDEAAVRGRVERIVAHCSQEAAVGRIRAWIADDPTAAARELGDRLWVLPYETNPWFAGASAGSRELLPEARHKEIADGPMMRPDLTAAAVRELTRSAAR
jgi:pimeloyl-ACP methyl ester carboxylesterase